MCQEPKPKFMHGIHGGINSDLNTIFEIYFLFIVVFWSLCCVNEKSLKDTFVSFSFLRFVIT